MAKVTLTAVHRIGLGNPNKNGQIKYVEPGKNFAIDEKEAAALVEQGAATVVEASTGEAKVEKTDTGGGGADDAEAVRQARLQEAKDLGIKGLRKDSSLDKINEAIAAHEAENGDDDGEGDDDEEELV